MSDLLKEGERIPPFVLMTTQGRPLRYAQLLHRRRIVLIVLEERPQSGSNTYAWLAEARKRAAELEERDMTVLVLTARTDDIPEVRGGPFVVLRDPEKRTIEKLGGAPAFYLIGKDTGIKQSSRACPDLRQLFALVDSMPMRRDEMQREERKRF